MKNYSDTIINKTDLDAVDAKQTKQILNLRIWLGVVFVTNLAATVALGLHLLNL